MSESDQTEHEFLGWPLELRATAITDEEGIIGKLEGLAVPYGKWSPDLGGFREKFAPGTFKEYLSSDGDTALTFEHNINGPILARRNAGTLSIRSTAEGLVLKADIPDTQLGRDTLVQVRRKDFAGLSIGFFAEEDKWTFKRSETELDERTVTRAILPEITLTWKPVYSDTRIAEARYKAKCNALIEQEVKRRARRLRLIAAT